MRTRIRSLLVLAAVVAVAALIPGAASAAPGYEPLNAYLVTANGDQLAELQKRGFDLHETGHVVGQAQVSLVLTASQAASLRAAGMPTQLVRRANGQTSAQFNRRRAAAANGYNVYRSYSEPGGIADEMRALALANPGHTKLENIGDTLNGKPILALKVTRNAQTTEDGARPAVLYIATQHAREWLATETARRLMHHFVDNYGKDATITNLVNEREVWFVPVANPDGYDFTFTCGPKGAPCGPGSPDSNRLWRKNLRDVDGDGRITSGDGVDPNRNFPTNWGYDEEGSSGNPANETYRGAGPASEPETRAMDGLMRRVRFKYMVNYHTAAQLLLYPFGFQVDTYALDSPIFEALAGTDADPAIPAYDPDVSSELYTTNGDTIDHAISVYGILAFTPELDVAPASTDPNASVSVFEFPDDEAQIQEKFQKNIPFALNVAESAGDPENPANAGGQAADTYQVKETPDFITDPFQWSYGDPQPVQVTAKRSLGAIETRYRINGGPILTTTTREWNGGERYGDNGDVYYHVMRGVIHGTKVGDSVQVWFHAANGQDSASFTYQAVAESGAQVLVLAAEDYTGSSAIPAYPSANGPFYAEAHQAALTANGIESDLYDIDARNRTAPHPLGVLSHYRAVLYYTGNDNITRSTTEKPGSAGRLAEAKIVALRDYMNEGGKVFYTGHMADRGFNLQGQVEYPAQPGAVCDGDFLTTDDGCIPLSDDFFQYYLGHWVTTYGIDANGAWDDLPVTGAGPPFPVGAALFTPNAGTGTEDDPSDDWHPAQFLTTSSFLDPAEFPQFLSVANSKYTYTGKKPFEPYTGDYYAYSQSTNLDWKRLTRTVDLTGIETSAALRFRMSWDVEANYDMVLVEARHPGQDDWTTLPDVNGNSSPDAGGASCEYLAGYHQFITHYETYDPETKECTPTGTTGALNGFTGRSGVWRDIEIDLSAYKGTAVELSISYVTDPATLGTGVFVDDTEIVQDGQVTDATSFETDLGGWSVGAPPPADASGAPETNDAEWVRSPAVDFPGEEASGVTTNDSVSLGFGLQQLTAADRTRAVGDAFRYLLRTDEAPPVVRFRYPAGGTGATVGEPVWIRADALDDLDVVSVSFYAGDRLFAVDTSMLYQTWYIPTAEDAGKTITLRAVALDRAGNTAEATTTITVPAGPRTEPPAGGQNKPPTVRLTAPPKGTELVAGRRVLVSAEADDDQGVDRVAFYAGDKLLGVDRTAPFEVGYQPKLLAVRRVTLVAVATDNTGLKASARRTYKVLKFRPRGLSVGVRTEGAAGHIFVAVRGALLRPRTLFAKEACRGEVKIDVIGRGGRVVAHGRSKLPGCRFGKLFRIRTSALGAAAPRVRVTFLGNRSVSSLAILVRTRPVRAGRTRAL